MSKISQKLSAKLSIGITLLAVPIFVLAMGVLFLYSRHIGSITNVQHMHCNIKPHININMTWGIKTFLNCLLSLD